MNSKNPFTALTAARSQGAAAGIVSICSANPFVLQAAMETALAFQQTLLIETTANQVNQLGGYTGMQPADFIQFTLDIAQRCGYPPDQIVFGGDHLGPLVWQNLPEEEAMPLSLALIDAYVSAGFTKIHLDTSMHLASDDRSRPLPDTVCAARGAELCQAAEQAWRRRCEQFPNAPAPVYVIGSEVPTPGGQAQEEGELSITSPEAFAHAYQAFEDAFRQAGLDDAFLRVIAFVVQPGVEFSHSEVYAYSSSAAAALCHELTHHPNIVFEGHSTDYQTASALREMVADGIGILKVGPALTFACREALFALEMIERELLGHRGDLPLSEFRVVLDEAMCRQDAHWRKHYIGDEQQIRIDRGFSYYDRARYYLGDSQVTQAIDRLFANLEQCSIPLSLVSQYLPLSYRRLKEGEIALSPERLVLDHIRSCLVDYYTATAWRELP